MVSVHNPYGALLFKIWSQYKVLVSPQLLQKYTNSPFWASIKLWQLNISQIVLFVS